MIKISLCFILLLNLFRKQNTQAMGEGERKKSRNLYMGKEKWLPRNPFSVLSLKFQRFSLLSHLQTHQRQMHFLQVIWVLVLYCFSLSVPSDVLFQQLHKKPVRGYLECIGNEPMKSFLPLIASVIAESGGSDRLIMSN